MINRVRRLCNLNESREQTNIARMGLRFADLFAGLGGFNVALSSLGHECVFACEIDPALRALYFENFNLLPAADIRSVRAKDLPQFDVLCAGFPCQPFSKAGRQAGLADPSLGDLIWIVTDIARLTKPAYLILENVPNLLRHADGMTWRSISRELRHAGYHIDCRVLSPHQFGVPQVRERLYVVASRVSLDRFEWPQPTGSRTDLRELLDVMPADAKRLPSKVERAIDAWQTFVDEYGDPLQKPSFPIWGMEFGATYPFQTTTPWAIGLKRLRSFKGTLGQPLADASTLNGALELIPRYARARSTQFPRWKIVFIEQNCDLYESHRTWIERWKECLLEFDPSYQKFEWNFFDRHPNLWNTVIQLRGSGIRARLPDAAPSLVSLTDSQVPIIAWERRYLTVREGARLQHLDSLKHLPNSPAAAFRALGNAVSSEVARMIATKLFGTRTRARSVAKNSRHVMAGKSTNPEAFV